MIRIMVCEDDANTIEQIRSQIRLFSGPLLQEVNIYWLSGNRMLDHVNQYSAESHLAIVSMQTKEGLELAKSIHQKNSLCRLILHSGMKESLPDWIPAGPVSYCQIDQLCAEMQRLTAEIASDQNIFSFSSRKEKHFIPFRDIVYFQSELRYVDVVAHGKSQGRFQGKLDEVQEHTPPKMFLRIHQSYLVNLRFITGIDFASHEILISNGERLPISAKNYKQVCAELAERAES